MRGDTSWALTHEDGTALRGSMEKLLLESGAHGALLVDRGGQLLIDAGRRPDFDVTSFSTLAAADFSANDQLAHLLGETDFSSLFHQGARESMLLADIGQRAILVVMFDTSTTLGLVRLRLRSAVEELAALVHTITTRHADDRAARPALLAGAEDEIDQLFQ